MSNSNGIISKPVRLRQDVAAVLGTTSVNNLSALCRSSAIRKWSKYKPVQSEKISELTDNDRAAANWGYSWGSGYDNKNSFMDYVCSLAANTGEAWEYVRPTRNFRLLDFAGYNHNGLIPPINVVFDYENVYQYDIVTASENNPTTFSKAHFPSLSGKYTGLMFRQRGTSTCHVVTKPLSQSQDLQFDARTMNYGTYDVGVFLSDKQHSFDENINTDTYYPACRPHKVLVINQGVGITIVGMNAVRSNTMIAFDLRVTSASTDKQLTNFTLASYNGNTLYQSVVIGTITTPYNGGFVQIPLSSAANNLRASFGYGGVTHTKTIGTQENINIFI